MNVFLMSLLVAGIPPWLSAVVGQQEDEGKVNAHVVFVGTDGQDGGRVHVVVKSIGDAGATGAYAVAVAGGDKDGRNESHGVRVLKSVTAKDRGFLGVTIGSMADDDEGVMIQGVSKDSAAERAGLEAGDVILSIDGEAVEGDVVRTTKLVGAKKPGEEIEIIVLRDGEEQEVTAVLGERSDYSVFRFGDGEVLDVVDEVHTRGRMLRRDDDGNWVMEDLGELEALKDLPGNIQMLLPKSGSRTMQFFGSDSEKKIQIRAEHDGTMLMLSQDGDGEITVTRRDEDGEETVETYADSDALKAADEEAFDLLDHASGGNTFSFRTWDMDGVADGLGELKFDFDFDIDTGALHDGVIEWREKMEESLKGLGEAHALATEELQELMEKLKSGDGTVMGLHLKALPGALRSLDDLKDGFPNRLLMRVAKPKHTFKVQTDGTIEVRIRRGDSELVQLFDHEADLEREKPALYEKFRKLMDVDDE